MGVRTYDVPGSRPASQLTDGGIYIHACVCSAAALVVRASSLGLNLHVCARADRSHAAPHTHTHGVLAYGPRPARRTHARTPVLPRAARIRMRLRTLRGETGDRPIHRRLLYYYTCWCPCVMRERAVAWGAMRSRLDDETWVDVADGWMDGCIMYTDRPARNLVESGEGAATTTTTHACIDLQRYRSNSIGEFGAMHIN